MNNNVVLVNQSVLVCFSIAPFGTDYELPCVKNSQEPCFAKMLFSSKDPVILYKTIKDLNYIKYLLTKLHDALQSQLVCVDTAIILPEYILVAFPGHSVRPHRTCVTPLPLGPWAAN